MRKVLISLAATTSALAVAAPASAQIYGNLGPAYGYGYGYRAPANYGYGYGAVRNLQVRVDAIQRQISNLAQHRMITPSEYRSLTKDSREVERDLRHNARDGRGLTQRELYKTQRQIARLEQRVQHEVRDGRRWGYSW
jgi:hypothetical protein